MTIISNSILTFVIPWYGQDLMGGAEKLCRRTVENLNERGYKTEVFSTCSKEFLSDWSNYYSEGNYEINGVLVKRFPVNKRNVPLFDSINSKLLKKSLISESEEYEFIKNNINSDKMIKQIELEKEKRIYIFIPYLYGTTFFGCQICPERSIIIPCFHDESYAYMKIFREAFSKTKGMIFNSDPEKNLAEKIYQKLPPFIVPGVGVDYDFKTNPTAFKRKFELNDFILYAGRKDSGKNVDTLINYYCKYIEKNGAVFDLVITGPGNIQLPAEQKNHIHSLLLSREDLLNAYEDAFVTCQPSINESFSHSIMESWLCSTPVLVHAKCDVTKTHCIQSNGGLYFSNYDEFEECINFFLQNKKEANVMASNGKNYVLKNFSWDIIIKNYVNFIAKLFGSSND